VTAKHFCGNFKRLIRVDDGLPVDQISIEDHGNRWRFWYWRGFATSDKLR
jgi:hypothetical protein